MPDMIVATTTPPGRGGIGIVRASGPGVREVAVAVLGRLPTPRVATFARFRDADGSVLDRGLALFFPGPASFTGEDVLELHGHGSPVVLDALVERIVGHGARRARPGEFSERAFLNDRIDLAQAEGVAALIDAGSRSAARAAMRTLTGEFSRQVHDITAALTDLRVYVEAAIDFPEEEIDFLGSTELASRVADVHSRLDAVIAGAGRGRVLTEGLTVVIAGRPNAGKSTLLNRLAGHDAAIVTPIAGTTRDVLRERVVLDGLPLTLIDTAGLREREAAATDPVEQEGIRRARAEMERADHLLFVVDAYDDPAATSWLAERAFLPAGVPVTLVLNKSDRRRTGAHALAEWVAGRKRDPDTDPVELPVSAQTGEGLNALVDRLKHVAGVQDDDSSAFAARGRHLDALSRAKAAFDRALVQLHSRQGELVAEELRLAQDALGEITGAVHSDDLLGRIFGSFCIGK
jgi:tRNA modification GTPase